MFFDVVSFLRNRHFTAFHSSRCSTFAPTLKTATSSFATFKN
ncbi:Uncharacterised protein [Klebsiella pneumoniae]|nr:Uncharacterised protein [Klebsiella pneumoniae]